MIYTHVGTLAFEQAVQISKDDTGGPRLYKTPKGDIYPSITTVLGILSEDTIARWKIRVGEEVAHHESKWGRDRGTVLHAAVETLLRNGNIEQWPLIVRMLVYDLKPYLMLIDNIHGQEMALFADEFRIGGRCDVIGDYRGKLSIIDFKGSGRYKKAEWIENYFMQVAFYAYAYWERTGIKIQQAVILIAREKGQPQEFIVKPWDHWKRLKEVRAQYLIQEGI